ncbi:MAG: hypothetical protein R3C19_15060 [Planctomycetaceae bacterium]
MNKKQVVALTIFTGVFGVLLIVTLLWGILFGGSGGNIFTSPMPAIIWALAFIAAAVTAVAPILFFLWYPADGMAAAVAAPAGDAPPVDDEDHAEGGREEFADEDADDTLDGETFDADDDESEEVQMFDDGFDEEELDDFEDDEDFR